MRYQSILVPLRSRESAERILPPAVELARRDGAHLIGLHVKEMMTEVVYPGVIVNLDAVEAAQQRDAEALEALFREHTGGEDFVAEWRVANGAPTGAADQIVEHGRAVDLIVMAQANPDSDVANADLRLEQVIREAGRPVLIIPYAGALRPIGANALIGWSPTKEAARAAHDAIPLLAKGSKAAILTAHSKSNRASGAVATAKDLALCYDRHGISAEVVERTEDGISVGDLLLNEAFERGSDVIVVGAYGHSRVYDFVIGAVTTKLLGSMTVPVLFSA